MNSRTFSSILKQGVERTTVGCLQQNFGAKIADNYLEALSCRRRKENLWMGTRQRMKETANTCLGKEQITVLMGHDELEN